MKTISTLLALTAVAALAPAQIKLPPYIDLPTNVVRNPGFETAPVWNAWSDEGSYAYNVQDGTLYGSSFGTRSTYPSHSGGAAYAFGVSGTYYGTGRVSKLQQSVAATLGSKFLSASVWAYSAGQRLTVRIRYADGGLTSADRTFDGAYSGTGWQKWDFTGAITPNRTVVAIEFEASTNSYTSNDIAIDDVSLVKTVRTYL